MVTLLAAILLSAAPKTPPRATIYMHKSAKDALLLGCLRDGNDVHCFEITDFLSELGYRVMPKEEAAPKKEAASKKPVKTEL